MSAVHSPGRLAACNMDQGGTITLDEVQVRVFDRGGFMALFDRREMTLRLIPPPGFHTRERGEGNSNADIHPDAHTLGGQMPGLQREFSTQETYLNERGETAQQRPTLARLSLNVSNQCNMGCVYCYANGGRYYTAGMLMERDTALHAMNFAFRHFSAIDLVNFFGGEPTLNHEMIELVCRYSSFLHSRGITSSLPRFGLTTNAYSITEDLIHMLRAYDFGVSISLDGPKEIHDRLRITKDRMGTYDTVVGNITRVLDTGIVPEFECTYTAEHYRRGISPSSLMDFFHDHFGCHTLHCPMVAVDESDDLFIPFDVAADLYSKAIRYSIRNLKNGIPKSISLATRLLNNLASRTPIVHYCPAGKRSLTINADGNVYACFMLMEGEGFCLGHVMGKKPGARNFETISSLLRDANKWHNPACKECWAQPLCFGCLAEDMVRGALPCNRSSIPGQSSLCDLKRTLIEACIESVAESLVDEIVCAPRAGFP